MNASTNKNMQEFNFCESYGISAYEFMLIKDVLMRECVQSGNVHRSFLDNMIKIGKLTQPFKSLSNTGSDITLDKERTKAVFDFLVNNRIILESKKERPSLPPV